MNVYRHKHVEDIENFYGDVLFQIHQFPTIKSHLTAIAELMWQGIQNKNQALYHQISNYHPRFPGKSVKALAKTKFTTADCKTTIAHEYGFNGWRQLKEHLGNTTYDIAFESAVNHLVNGDFKALKQHIANAPDLLKKRSKYGHGAMLIHYTASNGVALWRQKVPANLPEITTWLLESGADVHAKMNVYGGAYDTLALLTTSTHPFEAGIGKEMIEILKKYTGMPSTG